jgi:peptidoglycan/xylan/chitin deacetylase (PgdA/CDA1 family)
MSDETLRWLRPVLQALQPQAILRIEGLRADQKMMALTIDDSPSPETTRILDMLRDHDATATFFIHGARIRGSAEKRMVCRIHDEGHANQSLRTLGALPVFFSELEKQGFKAWSLAHVEGASSLASKF